MTQNRDLVGNGYRGDKPIQPAAPPTLKTVAQAGTVKPPQGGSGTALPQNGNKAK
jgi:hypothetical protein